MADWTAAQREAIEDKGHSLIVCAAAGSGKTMVLTQRIVRLVAEGTPITAMLIVTFTRAAASEMRERIAESLRRAAEAARGEEKAWLARQSAAVGRAQISTLHSFCNRLLHEHFEALTLDPLFRLADAQECAVLRAAAMEDALFECYERGSEAFLAADQRFREEELSEMASRLEAYLETLPDPEGFVQEALLATRGEDEALLSQGAAGLVVRRARQRLARLCAWAQDNLDACVDGVAPSYATACEQDLAFLQGFAALDGYGAIAERFARLCPEGKIAWARAAARGKDIDKAATAAVKTRRDAIRKEAESILGDFSASAQEAAEDIRATGLPLEGLIELSACYGAHYREAKRRRNALDFGDLEREALRALCDEQAGVAQALAAQYRYVFVDEYQDSSEIQEAILSRFANLGRRDGLFQVGDVKQSIYRFRHASPALFRRKAALYADEANEDGRRIDLNQNFRSRAAVLSAVNAVFERILRQDATEIEYDERERLVCGLPPREDDPQPELHLLRKPPKDESAQDEAGEAPEESAQEQLEEEEEQSATRSDEREALLAAARMKALVGTPFYDAKSGQTRPLRWRDMAVLLRTVTRVASRTAEILAAEGVPVFCDVGQAYFEIPEVRALIAILRAIDNPQDDEALLAALRGPAIGLYDEELAEIRILSPDVPFAQAVQVAAGRQDALGQRLCQALARLSTWRLAAQHQGADRLIERILAESGMPLQAASEPGGAARLANLRLLQTRARSFAARQAGTLHAFLAYVERLRAGGDDASASAIGEGEDVVRLMSVHKSKGLEFPVVLLLGMGKQVVRKRPEILQISPLGVALPCVDVALGSRRETLLARGLALEEERAARAEEIRVLYVAMTRARERLILVGTLGGGKLPEHWFSSDPDEQIASIATELDMVCPMLAAAGASFVDEETVQAGGNAWHVLCHEEDLLLPGERREGLEERLRRLMHSARDAQMDRLLAFVPEVSAGAGKTSVSQLLRDEKFRQEEGAPPVREIELQRLPRFLQEKSLDGAAIGTAFHRVALLAELEPLRATSDLVAEIERQMEAMCARGILTKAERQTLSPRMLSALYASTLGRRMLRSPRVEREWGFTWRRPGAERVVLQGVIDCCFLEDGRWVLVDYKTDSASDVPAVLARHTPQLAVYAEALESLTGIPVASRVLWLVRASQAFEV